MCYLNTGNAYILHEAGQRSGPHSALTAAKLIRSELRQKAKQISSYNSQAEQKTRQREVKSHFPRLLLRLCEIVSTGDIKQTWTKSHRRPYLH